MEMRKVDETGQACLPVWKHQTSLKQSTSSHPPKTHAVWSTRVTLCARMPCVGSVPQTGALLQYMTLAGAGSASRLCGRWGIVRMRGTGSPLAELKVALDCFAGSSLAGREEEEALRAARRRTEETSEWLAFVLASETAERREDAEEVEG